MAFIRPGGPGRAPLSDLNLLQATMLWCVPAPKFMFLCVMDVLAQEEVVRLVYTICVFFNHLYEYHYDVCICYVVNYSWSAPTSLCS